MAMATTRRARGGWSWGLIFSAVGLVGLSGCVTGSKGLSNEEKDSVKAYILEAVPDDLTGKLDINFENKVRIVGYKVEPPQGKPGQEVKVTTYWRCEDKVEDGWMLFTHMGDDGTGRAENLDWVGPLRERRGERQLLGPDRWEKGKVYADEQTYRIPDGVVGQELTVYQGIWKDSSRLRVMSGPQDGDNRAIVAKIKTGVQPKPKPSTPALTARKLGPNEKIVVDGKGDEPAWKDAAFTGAFVDVGTGQPNTTFPVQGGAKVAWDDTNLYVLFDVTDPDVVGGFDAAKKASGEWTATGQPKLWTKDTVEIMVDPDGNGDNKDYYEIQVNPQNKVFKSQFDAYNEPKTEPDGPFGHEDWDPKLKSAVVVKGTLDKAGDKDEGYTVEIAIPWAGFTKAASKPPKPGDTWRMNFYAMQNNGGTAWSAILGMGNFHKASRFGTVTWSLGRDATPPEPTAGVAAALGKGDGGAEGPKSMQGLPKAVVQATPAKPAAK